MAFGNHGGKAREQAAYHCAMGDDFGGVTFEQSAMRRHLIECFERRQLFRFPLSPWCYEQEPCTTIISSYKMEDGVITSCLFQSFRLLYAARECYAEASTYE